jgi:RNA polymerase sigma-70 factor (ECF subfamily)
VASRTITKPASLAVADIFVEPRGEVAAETGAMRGWLAEALDRLPPEQLRALQLARVDGLSHEQIAAELGVTKRRVEMLLAKALSHCIEAGHTAEETI